MSTVIGRVPNEIGERVAVGVDEDAVVIIIGDHPAARFSAKDSEALANDLKVAAKDAEANRQFNESAW